jgi:hypothetical protein
VVSQLLTLFTTPVVYLYMDRFAGWSRRQWKRVRGDRDTGAATTQPAAGTH